LLLLSREIVYYYCLSTEREREREKERERERERVVLTYLNMEGTKEDKMVLEWLIFLHRFENQPSSA